MTPLVHSAAPQWFDPPLHPSLGSGDVHIWRVGLTIPPPRLIQLAAYLNDAESTRAGRFVFESDKAKYVAARGALRVLLGRYLSLEPAEIDIKVGPRGKPFLPEQVNREAIRFNLSHSSDLCLIAVAKQIVGVDVERIREEIDVSELAARHFANSERAAMAALPPNQRLHAFFRCWTRKEAYVKARGDGLEISLDEFEVSVGPDTIPPVLVSKDSDRWELYSILPGQGFVGALVAERPVRSLSFWDFS